jgi:glycosyltransferase involved in cell wall biosynthesis
MKKKILLLSDDLRLHSGVGNMSKEIVMGTVDKFDWVQLGGAVKHPEEGKMTDMSEQVQKETGVADAMVRVYPVSGYGNEQILRQLIKVEKPDMIIHFTDPRFWGWLYQMEHEIRQRIPIGYINIWDDLPFPHWNEDFYESCDLLMAISKQTYNINKHVCQRKPRVEGKDLFYTPHGIDEKKYFPITKFDVEFDKFQKNSLPKTIDCDFIAFLNSRNIRRKGTSDLIAGFKKFQDGLTEEQRSKVALLLHTDPVDSNGTDLPAVVHAIAPDIHCIFSAQKLPNIALNYLYNIADVVCNPSSAEGFGLSHMEGMMSGTPTIATVVGGLQDQMGFRTIKSVDGVEGATMSSYIDLKDFTADVPSNSTGMMTEEHGPWTYPLWPNPSIQGSPMTPYIYDSRPTIDDIAIALRFWYDAGDEERKRCGSIGRDWAIENGFTTKDMANDTANAIQSCFDTFKPRQKYTIINTSDEPLKYPSGALI